MAIKTIFSKISFFLQEFSRARAAAELAKYGRYDLAKKLMN